MQYAISFDASRRLLTITVQGAVDMASCEEVMPEVAARFAAHQFPPVLVDSRDALPELTPTDVYRLGSEIFEVGLGRLSRFAVVTVPRSDFDRAAFLERIAGNRGLQVQAFRDPDEALRWVLG
jgi:SpoIIAA-like